MTIAELNGADAETFVEAVGFAFEHSPWIARAALASRPFADARALHAAMCDVVRRASVQQRVALIASHPHLAGRVAREGGLTPASAGEQASAELDRLSPDEAAQFESLNAAYLQRFGFPFVICARDQTKESILRALEKRARNDSETEFRTAIAEICDIARLRLLDAVDEP